LGNLCIMTRKYRVCLCAFVFLAWHSESVGHSTQIYSFRYDRTATRRSESTSGIQSVWCPPRLARMRALVLSARAKNTRDVMVIIKNTNPVIAPRALSTSILQSSHRRYVQDILVHRRPLAYAGESCSLPGSIRGTCNRRAT